MLIQSQKTTPTCLPNIGWRQCKLLFSVSLVTRPKRLDDELSRLLNESLAKGFYHSSYFKL